MKILKSIHRILTITLSLAFLSGLILVGGISKVESYPAEPGCDDSGCHYDIRNTNDSGEGSLRWALEEGCARGGNHLVQFSRSPDPAVFNPSTPYVMNAQCQGTFTFAGMVSKEVTFDGSQLPQTETSPTGNNCLLYVATNNHSFHHLTFVNAPYAVCAIGNNISISDNLFGVRRDGTVAANRTGVYLHGNQSVVYNNVVAGNQSDGILVRGHQNQIKANFIGVRSGELTTDKGNGGSGIRLTGQASRNVIGGHLNTHGNTIRYNKKGGVVLAGDQNSTRNKISHNVISRNKGLGIDLKDDKVSLPSPGDTGPNTMLAMPVGVETIPMQTGSNPTRWMFRARVPANVYYEIYLVDTQDESDADQVLSSNSYGEGDQLLTSGWANRGPDGYFGVQISNPILTLNRRVSALVRDEQGNTSEFSAAVKVTDHREPGTDPNCGNGVVNSGEDCDGGQCCDATCHWKPVGSTCDDGNASTTGDACNATHDCTGTPSTCGNGVVNAGEQCDVGPDQPNDCCSATCQFIPMGTVCDDGNAATSGDQCNGAGNCNGTPVTCGNSVVDAGEDCDGGQCCDATCHWKPAGSVCDDSNPATSGDVCDALHNCNGTIPGCGNGVVGGAEACDDGNLVNGDGCSSVCGIEPGYGCVGSPSVCTPICGDSVITGTEACDDGNIVNSDGCSSVCAVEPGWTCSGTPSVCVSLCGNSIVDAGEQCDGGQCCDSSCHFKAAGAACNDGNPATSGDQCNASHVCTGTTGGGGTTVPNNPTGLTADPEGPNDVRVTFTDGSDNETGFKVERADGDCSTAVNFAVVGTLPASPGVGATIVFIDHTAEPDHEYCYQAKAFNPNGDSTPSNRDGAHTPTIDGALNPPLSMSLFGGGCTLSPIGGDATGLVMVFGMIPVVLVRMRRMKKK